MTISHDELIKHIHYDPETGAFTRLIKSSASAKVGPTLGNPRGDGYRALSVCGKEQYLHRLAWFYVHKSWPKFVIDHINGDKTDNRLCNLRDIPQKLNLQNIRKSKGRGPGALLGVARFRDRFRADIRIDGKKKHLGVFASAEAAHEAYLDAKRKYHPAAVL